MPAIFDLLYREYCRARLAEMRRQLLIAGASAEVPQADYDVADDTDPAGIGGTGTQYEIGRGAPH